jgi:hypothetical protein
LKAGFVFFSAALLAGAVCSAAHSQSSNTSGVSWADVGIGAAEAAQWKAAGVPFPEWANQWKSEGFVPSDAQVWVANKVNVYTAADFRSAGFSVTEATAWIANGIRSAKRANEFRNAEFGAVEAARWWRLRFTAEEATPWKQDGFSAEEALAWKYGEKEYFIRGPGYSVPTYSVDWARPWRTAGFTPDDARLANAYEIKFDEAEAWRQAGFGFQEAMMWRDAGFKPIDAAAERASGMTAIGAEARRRTAPDDVLSLDADIVVNTDATLVVTETIVIDPARSDRCLPRVFPTNVVLRRSTGSGQSGSPSYRFTSVRRNGADAGYRLERDAWGTTICLEATPGESSNRSETIQIAYQTNDRLLFFQDHYRLFFSLKDRAPAFTVSRASATVHLPRGVNTVSADGFAGPPNRKYFTADVEETTDGDIIRYSAARPLGGDMEFAVAVDVTKPGLELGFLQRAWYLNRDYDGAPFSLLAFLAGIISAAIVYMVAWWRVGRDPKKRAIVPIYEPPGRLTPALMRYLETGRRADVRTLGATLVSLAQLGALRIQEQQGRYRIERSELAVVVHAAHEAEFLAALFEEAPVLILGSVRARWRLRRAAGVLRKALRRERARYIVRNTRYLLPGIALSTAGFIAAIALVEWDSDANAYAAMLLILLVGFNGIFLGLLKAPTEHARRLLDDIEGFRHFLEAAYRDGLTPSLPYAMALGVDSERASVLDTAAWYSGRSGGFSGVDFTRSLFRRAAPAVRT